MCLLLSFFNKFTGFYFKLGMNVMPLEAIHFRDLQFPTIDISKMTSEL
jgi:hypothetical protein